MIKKNEWYVNCKMPELTGGLAKLARKNGWHRAGNEDSTTDRKFLTCTSGSCICTNNQTYENFEEITIDEAIRRLEAGPPNDDRILVEEQDCGRKLSGNKPGPKKAKPKVSKPRIIGGEQRKLIDAIIRLWPSLPNDRGERV